MELATQEEKDAKQALVARLQEKYENEGPSRISMKLDSIIESLKTYRRDYEGKRVPLFLLSRKQGSDKKYNADKRATGEVSHKKSTNKSDSKRAS